MVRGTRWQRRYWNSPNGVFSIQTTVAIPGYVRVPFRSDPRRRRVHRRSVQPTGIRPCSYLRPRDDVTVNAQCCNSLALSSPSAAYERHRGTPTRHLMMSAHDSVDGSTASIAMNPSRLFDNNQKEAPSEMNFGTIGSDHAKRVFCIHGIDAAGQAFVRRQPMRCQFLGILENLEPRLVWSEACDTAHCWGCELTALGYDPKHLRYTPLSSWSGPDRSAIRSIEVQNYKSVSATQPHFIALNLGVFSRQSEKLCQQEAEADQQVRSLERCEA